MAQYASGYLAGTGAAVNIETGFWPDFVRVTNLSARSHIWEANLTPIIEFDTGATTHRVAVEAGDIVSDQAGTWSAVVREVVIHTGTFATDNAEGFLILESGSIENRSNIADNDVIYVSKQKGASGVVTDIMVDDTDGVLETGIEMATTFATEDDFLLYTSATASRGFTIPDGASPNNALLFWQAFGQGVG